MAGPRREEGAWVGGWVGGWVSYSFSLCARTVEENEAV